MAIQDAAMGFVPKTHPKFYTVFKQAAAGAELFRFGPVKLVGGYCVEAAITGPVAGICLAHYAASPGAVTDVIVCTDPDQVYECTGDAVGDITDVGKFASLVAVGGTGDLSDATLKVSTATATVSADTPFLIMEWSNRTVTNAAAASNLKCLVKLVEQQTDKGFPAA